MVKLTLVWGGDWMAGKQQKKLLILNILDILKKYSDESHRLSQKDIAEILEKEYGTPAERKAIRRNIIGLIAVSYTHLDVYKRQLLASLTLIA